MTFTATLSLTNPYLKGDNVRHAQGLLIKRGYMHGAADGVYGPVTAAAVRHAKIVMGYPQSKINGMFGATIEAYLSGRVKPTAAMKVRAALRRRQRVKAADSEGARRQKIVRWARWGADHEASIHYNQGASRMHAIGHPGTIPLSTDCSGFATLCYNWAGAPDPNQLRYNGQGFTGTLLNHMRKIPIGLVRAGDLVVYGNYPGAHVCIVVVAGSDPVLVSHGQEAGPITIRHSVEHAAHGNGAVTWLTLPRWS